VSIIRVDGMNTIGVLTDLFRHMEWADALIWKSVLKDGSVTYDPTVRERLHHIHLCQQAWLQIWLGQSVDPQVGESFSVTRLASWAREYHEDLEQYLARVEETDLAVEVAVPGMGGTLPRPCLGETFLQITAHSTYHRGQVSLRLREIGGEPPQTDFITWVISGKPKAEWPDNAQ
jgi:uncharacterized damage-inducible protein DinB